LTISAVKIAFAYLVMVLLFARGDLYAERAQRPAHRLHPQQEGQQRRLLAADVHRREHDRRNGRRGASRGGLRRVLGL
jgi:hypothetical protein